jgi:hypothetical protein
LSVFKIGDRVRYIWTDGFRPHGAVGTVVPPRDEEEPDLVEVVFDGLPSTYKRTGGGYFCFIDALESIDEPHSTAVELRVVENPGAFGRC